MRGLRHPLLVRVHVGPAAGRLRHGRVARDARDHVRHAGIAQRNGAQGNDLAQRALRIDPDVLKTERDEKRQR